jgi:hypothetical protein
MKVYLHTLWCAALLFLQCNKTDTVKDAFLIVELKATSSNFYQAIQLEVQGVKVRFDGPDTGASATGSQWVWLKTKTGGFDFLQFASKPLKLADGGIPKAEIKEMRLLLGRNNTITVRGEPIALDLPAGAELGFSILHSKNLQRPRDTVFLRFHSDASVIQKRPGLYELNPAITVTQ